MTRVQVFTDGPADLRSLDAFEELEYLTVHPRNALAEAEIDLTLPDLATVPGLRYLHIDHAHLADSELRGVETLHNLRELELWNTRLPGTALERICLLTDLEALDLSWIRPPTWKEQSGWVTDANLRSFKKLKNLRDLRLSCQPINDAGLAHLGELRRLRKLEVGRCNIQGHGLRHLEGLKDLEELDLSATMLDEEFLAHVGWLTNLRKLNLNWVGFGRRSPDGDIERTPITDVGFAHLGNLKRLVELRLGDSKLTDRSMKAIGQFEHLQFLDLTGAPITDEGLGRLHGLKDLKEIDLSLTCVTDDGIARLRRAVPSIASVSNAFLQKRSSRD